jgi:peptidoglycan/LPS O-acetylase OafA/YrhL
VPPFWAALVIFGLVELLGWSEVVKGLLLIPAVNGEPLRTLWYVNMLVLFYAAAPLLLILRHRLIARTGSRPQAQLLIGACLTVTLGVLARHPGGLDPRILLYFPAFAVGLLLSGELLGHGDGPAPLRSRGLALLAALAPVAVAVSLGVHGHAIETSLRALPMATLLPALLVVVSCRRLRGWSLPGWLRATSSASFFIYLLHRPLLKGLRAAAAGLEPAHPWWLLVVLLTLGVPLIVGLSWWGQRLYDRALRALGW